MCTPNRTTLKSKFQPYNSYINHNCSHVDLSVHFVNVVLHNRGLSIGILLPNTITFQLFKFESMCESILYLMYFIITQKYQYIAKVLIDISPYLYRDLIDVSIFQNIYALENMIFAVAKFDQILLLTMIGDLTHPVDSG